MSSRRLAAAIAGATFILTGVCTHPARALDAFWIGVRTDLWGDGIQNGVLGPASNWYSEPPPNGLPREVPDGKAMFTPAAQSFRLAIRGEETRIGRMNFTSDAPLYTFIIDRKSKFYLNGAGLLNHSRTAPQFTIRVGAVMQLTNEARLAGVGARAAQIAIERGRLMFSDYSHGGDAAVSTTNGSSVEFDDAASAAKMEITNSGGRVIFDFLATADRAHIINKNNGVLDFERARGPNNDFQMPIGEVNNSGNLLLRDKTLRVAQNFTHGFGGRLSIGIGLGRFGSIVTGKKAAVGGTLSVFAAPNVKASTYKIVRAGGLRTGKFAELNFVGPATLKARLAYSVKEVTLILEKK